MAIIIQIALIVINIVVFGMLYVILIRSHTHN